MKVKQNIPNLLTLCNLLCGCLAIVFAFEGNLVWSAYLVGIACVFDFLDGMVARLLGVHSEIGKQLDSLADMVSFGVVPGAIMFQMIRFSFISLPPSAGIPSEIVLFARSNPYFFYYSTPAFLITIFSAIRLAKFNLDIRQRDSFIGLPTPANTILIASLVLIADTPSSTGWTAYLPLAAIVEHKELMVHDTFFGFNGSLLENIILNPYFLISLSLISSFLLVAPLPLFALKFKNFSWADNKVRYLFLALSLALLITFRFAGIPLIIVLYIVLSIINNLISRKKLE